MLGYKRAGGGAEGKLGFKYSTGQMKNKHAPYKTVKEKRLSSGDERQSGGREIHSLPHSCLICKVLRNQFFFIQEDEKILLKPKGSAIIFGQLEQ